MSEQFNAEMQTILQWAARDHGAHPSPEGFLPEEAFLVPPGWKLEKAPWTRDRPPRIVGNFEFTTAESFCRYFQAFRKPGALLMATLGAGDDPPSFRGVLDYHEGPDSPNWCGHSIGYRPKPTPQWVAWLAVHGGDLTQEEFAEHLEANLGSVTKPEGSILLRIINDFSVDGKLTFSRAVRLQDGTVKFQYATEHTARCGELVVPRSFTVELPIYEGEPSVELESLLSYRIGPGGALKLNFKFRNLEWRLRQLAADIASRMGQAVALTPYWTK